MRKTAVLLLVLGVCLPGLGWTQDHLDVEDLLSETQQQMSDADKLTVVWWIPLQFWEASLAQDQTLTAEGKKQLLSVLRPYLVIVVLDGTLGPMGGATFKPEEALRAELKVLDARGRSYEPLTDKNISADAKNLVQAMRPILSNMMGQFGENFRFFLFPARDSGGGEIADAMSDDDFAVQLGEKRFHWRLPLGSILPKKVCPEDGELLSGAWTYCPWHGAKLKTQELPPPGVNNKTL